MKILFTPSAERQFTEAMTYIYDNNPDAAETFREKSGNVLKRLEKFPRSGRRLPEFPELPHREVIVFPYRFFYKILDETIWIIAVWHCAQNVTERGKETGDDVKSEKIQEETSKYRHVLR